ncbi:organoarsenical effux MFS transporter ArsJ [Simiduia sp. 21SJ11W-1]|uniref:organoarsenical effux MFS transporter ArsJ n=1 Tax=Simiduia sp. 21SJ11W-1 TaxID=2909669 RepID=UPI00209EFFD9|nr:organoarsenical effux MFS transporter ArsJ [Simiduia sp. 21SJ11W-1]UTA47103.1 organoarsenical effux MFS transporter ArsJ [Simiduia sp. 21SJ11W-1]
MALTPALRQYAIITGNYWAFTLTDGALRMLVVLHFHALGFSPLALAMLFVLYELLGVVTNLLGGWLGARLGLNHTMNLGLGLQIVALGLLLAPTHWLTLPWVMVAQAISGVAKDLNKMSAKSAIKLLVPSHAQGKLFRWVARLTGSKNALKGVGFFLGGALLSGFGFAGAVLGLLLFLLLVWVASLLSLSRGLGKATRKPKFRELFSKSAPINYLSGARLFLFGARDVWFVIALPVYLASTFGWSHWGVGSFLACWVIGYGVVQSLSPRLFSRPPERQHAIGWALALAAIPALLALGLMPAPGALATGALGGTSAQLLMVVAGLGIFGAVFAINSALHSYLIVRYANRDGVSLDVGFYYMANAAGRLMGTVLSGWLFQSAGFTACLWVSAALVVLAAVCSLGLPAEELPARELPDKN